MRVIKTGLDVLLDRHVGEVAGRRVGVLANQASVTREMVDISDALIGAGVSLTALFGPEHGARGDSAAGQDVADYVDERLGIPVYSLYGERSMPSPETLRNIDLMLVDLQDVGARFYTFASTMALVMEACGKVDVPVWVLDRPNPISGTNPEGPVLEPEFASFVGMYPIPIRHGLTIGELARLIGERFGVGCDLRVVAMEGWTRGMFFHDTALRWVAPSPAMPKWGTALYYPGTCLFEGTNVSEGRGSARPFEEINAPWLNAFELVRALDEYCLPGVEAHPDALCHMVSIRATDRRAFRPVLTGVALLCALRRVHPDDLEFLPEMEDGRRFFDLLAGTSALREQIVAGASPWDIATGWEQDVAAFVNAATDVMLYPE